MTIFTQIEYQMLLKTIMLGQRHLKPEERMAVNILTTKLRLLAEKPVKK